MGVPIAIFVYILWKKVMFSEYLKLLVEELNAMKDGFIVNLGELSARFVLILTHVVADW